MTNRNNFSLSIGLLILRLALGVTFLLHGWQKFNEWTIAGTTAAFTEMGVPLANATAPLLTWLELIGGILLILGAATRILGILFAIDMIGAIALVHAPAGFFVTEGGYEHVMILGAVALALAFTGPGAYAVDALFNKRRGSSVRA